MILYHGSNVEVRNPRIINSNFGRDFGQAFYLTPIKEQAERMAKRKVKIERSGVPTVSIFDFDENYSHLKSKKYEKANLEWIEMVLTCRSDPGHKHGYDIVEGKIADDTVGVTILMVLDGDLTKEEAIKKLAYQKINYQVAFCSDESLEHLTYVESYEVKE